MRVIAAFPDIGNYVDRILMYRELSKVTASFHVITRPSFDERTIPPRGDRLVFELVDEPGKLAFQRKAFVRSKQLIENLENGDQRVVLQDVFYGRLAVPYRFRPAFKAAHDAKCVVSIFTPNHYLFKLLWLRTGKPHYSLAEHWFYVRMYARWAVLEYLSCRCADGIVCNSPAIADYVENVYHARAKVAVLPTAVDALRFQSVEKLSKSQLGLPEKPILLSVGWVQGRKGIYTILEALHLLQLHSAEFHMVFVGPVTTYDQEAISQYVERYQLHGLVSFLGKKGFPELVSYYSAADLLLCPSLSEGSPRVVKEAMVCGCPVIGSDIPGIKMLDPSGDIITTVPVGDAQALAEAVAFLLANPDVRRQKASRGRELITRRFSPQVVAASVRDFYESLWS